MCAKKVYSFDEFPVGTETIVGNCKIILNDCISVLKGIPSESVDLVYADPPFNIGLNYDSPIDDRREDYVEWCQQWIAECFRILKPTGSFYMMTIAKHLCWKLPIMQQHGVFINIIIWRRIAANHTKRQFWSSYIPIMLFGKTGSYKFNTYAERQLTPTSFTIQHRNMQGQFKDTWDDIRPLVAGMVKGRESILCENKNYKKHPTQMPIGLARRALLFSTDAGDTVLDPFAGSGTVALACTELNRKNISIEISPVYYKMILERLQAVQPELPIFQQQKKLDQLLLLDYL